MQPSWFGERQAPPEIGLPVERIADVMREELRELPLPVLPIALQPFVVPKSSYRELLTATADLLQLLRKTVVQLAPDRAGRIAALGLDPDDCPYWVDDENFELRHCADIARADVVIGHDGPKFVEMNVSGAIGGMVHFQLYQRAWRRVRELAGQPSFVGVDTFAQLAALIKRTCAELGTAPSAAIVGTTREWGAGVPSRHFDFQVAELRQHGVNAVHLDFEDLLDGIGLPDRLDFPLGIAEFTEYDASVGGYDIGPVGKALDGGFRVIPSASSWLVHTKKLLAMVSEGLPWMNPAERELVERYVPWSRLVGDRDVRWRGDGHNLPELLVDRQENFILKGATGDAGREVVFGERTSPGEWAKLIDDAVRTGYHMVQEVVPTPPYPVDVMVNDAGDIERVQANSVISPFCIGGTPTGCFARFVPEARPGVISALSNARLSCLLAEA
ncbi:MAG: hypothetical protein ACRDNL_28175 [Spirillospora sp.]